MAERCFYSAMTAERLIGYCDLHCETPRALFGRDMVAQMVLLAGEPEDWDSPEDIASGQKWMSLKEEMKELVNLATKRMSESLSA